MGIETRNAREIALARSREAKLKRLRERVKQAADANPQDPLPGILQGMLDLLEDEL